MPIMISINILAWPIAFVVFVKTIQQMMGKIIAETIILIVETQWITSLITVRSNIFNNLLASFPTEKLSNNWFKNWVAKNYWITHSNQISKTNSLCFYISKKVKLWLLNNQNNVVIYVKFRYYSLETIKN